MYRLPEFYYSGLSGLALPIAKYDFPPEFSNSSRLTYYSSIFNSIEINSSFYKIPMPATIAKWAASVPEDFRFTFKLFREITHCKDLQYDRGNIERFIETISNAGMKKACLLVQFPPGLKTTAMGQFENLMKDLREADPLKAWNVAVEFRNSAWYNEDVYEILSYYDVTLVQQDIPRSATPFIDWSSDVVYVRFHGPTGNYRGTYTDDFLSEYAGYIREWLADGRRVYVYFNNTMGEAFNNLMTLNSFLRIPNS